MTDIDDEIAAAKAHLDALYAKRKEMRKKAKRPTGKEQEAKAVALIRGGMSIKDAAIQMGRSYSVVKNYLWSVAWDRARERMLADGRATVVKPNQWGGEDWEYDEDEFRAEVRKILKEWSNQ